MNIDYTLDILQREIDELKDKRKNIKMFFSPPYEGMVKTDLEEIEEKLTELTETFTFLEKNYREE